MSVITAKKPKDIFVSELMSKKVISVGDSFTVPDIAHILTTQKISSAPVVDSSNAIVGFVTLGDCLKCMVNCLYHDQLREKKAADIMSKSVLTIRAHADLFELENFFASNNIHQAPVIGPEGELLGMISRTDAVSAIEKLYTEALKYKMDIKEPLELTLTERMKYLIKDIDIGE